MNKDSKKTITIPRWEYYLLYFIVWVIAFTKCLDFLNRICNIK